jgi:uncharacterized protein YbaR (Trm112 family)
MDHSEKHKLMLSHIDPRLLEILVCPVTKSALIYDEHRSTLISKAAQLVFPIRNGIPILLLEESEPYINDHEISL